MKLRPPEEDEYILSNSHKTFPPRCAARCPRFGAKDRFHLAADDHDQDEKYSNSWGNKKQNNTEDVHEVMTTLKIWKMGVITCNEYLNYYYYYYKTTADWCISKIWH